VKGEATEKNPEPINDFGKETPVGRRPEESKNG